MLQSVNPLSSISLMKSVSVIKSLGSNSTDKEEKSKGEQLKEKIEELEKKVNKKEKRIGGGSLQPVPNDKKDNRNRNPFDNNEHPFKKDPFKDYNPQDLEPKRGDNKWEWKTTNGNQTHQIKTLRA